MLALGPKAYFPFLALSLFFVLQSNAPVRGDELPVCRCENGHTYPACGAKTGDDGKLDCGRGCDSYDKGPQETFFGQCKPKEVVYCLSGKDDDLKAKYNGHNKFDLFIGDEFIYSSPSLETGSVTKHILTDGKLVELSGNFWIRCHDDLLFGHNYVSVRNGRNLDLMLFIGLGDGKITTHNARLQDGQHHGVTLLKKGPLITLGRNKDVHIQYCFDGNKWSSSGIYRPSLTDLLGNPNKKYNLDCDQEPITFFNGGSVVPAKEPPVCSGYPKSGFDDAGNYCIHNCDPATGSITYSNCKSKGDVFGPGAREQ